MIDQPPPAPGYRWATHADPDFLVLQLPPVPVPSGAGPGARDAMKALLARRGFRAVAQADRLDLRAANGCALTRTGSGGAELTVSIGDQVGASRIPLPGIDADWLDRAIRLGHAAVLVADTAVDDDGATSQERLRRDVDAGGVLAALVPSRDEPA